MQTGEGTSIGLAGRCQIAGCGVDMENDDVVRILIFRKQICAGGIDGEMAGRFAASQNLAERCERSLFFVDGEDRDAVMTAIRSVKKFSRRMHGNFGGLLGAGEIPGERRETFAVTSNRRSSSDKKKLSRTNPFHSRRKQTCRWE